MRFEEAKSEIERIGNISRRVSALDMKKVTQDLSTCYILNKDADWLLEIKNFIQSSFALMETANVYLFFQR